MSATKAGARAGLRAMVLMVLASGVWLTTSGIALADATTCAPTDVSCVGSTVNDTTGDATSTVDDTVQTGQDQVNDTVGQAEDQASDAVDAVADTVQTVKEAVLGDGSTEPDPGGPPGGGSGGSGGSSSSGSGDSSSGGAGGTDAGRRGDGHGGSTTGTPGVSVPLGATAPTSLATPPGTVGGRNGAPSTSGAPTFRAAVAGIAAAVVLPLLILSGCALAFVAAQGRLDRRDPRLAMAPVVSDVLRFE